MTPIPALIPMLSEEVVREVTHRSGWVWRYEHKKVAGIGTAYRVWKRRWCVLRNNRMAVYKDQRVSFTYFVLYFQSGNVFSLASIGVDGLVCGYPKKLVDMTNLLTFSLGMILPYRIRRNTAL
jgi:hypothetical protein